MSMLSEILRMKKRLQLRINRKRGKIAEEVHVLRAKAQQKDIRRTGKGSDYRSRASNPFTGQKSSWVYEEIKSSPTASLSKLQKKTQKKLKGKYRVVRY